MTVSDSLRRLQTRVVNHRTEMPDLSLFMELVKEQQVESEGAAEDADPGVKVPCLFQTEDVVLLADKGQ